MDRNSDSSSDEEKNKVVKKVVDYAAGEVRDHVIESVGSDIAEAVCEAGGSCFCLIL